MKKKYYLICMLVQILIPLLGGMKLHEYLLEFYDLQPVDTEYSAYELLKKYPLEQEINYVVIPWVELLFRKKLDLIPPLKFEGGFTICQHPRFREILPILRRIGINVLFTPHATEQVFDGIRVLPFPHFTVNGVDPSPTKNILYSFIGFESHPVRKKIFNLPKQKDTVIIKRDKWHAVSTEKNENKEYRDILSRSRFSLCPRGLGPSSIRFWESLQAGAIPVLLADELVLPHNFDWSSCIIRLPESEISNIDKILRNISDADEKTMRRNCLKANKKFSGTNFVSIIRDFYNLKI